MRLPARLALVVFAAAPLVVPAAARAATVTLLPASRDANDVYLWADVNSSGQVAGTVFSNVTFLGRAVRWSNGAVQVVGASATSANAIDARGVLLGDIRHLDPVTPTINPAYWTGSAITEVPNTYQAETVGFREVTESGTASLIVNTTAAVAHAPSYRSAHAIGTSECRLPLSVNKAGHMLCSPSTAVRNVFVSGSVTKILPAYALASSLTHHMLSDTDVVVLSDQSTPRVVLWHPLTGRTQALRAAPGGPTSYSQLAITPNGSTVIGTAGYANGSSRVYLWRSGQAPVLLRSLLPSGTAFVPTAPERITSDGVILTAGLVGGTPRTAVIDLQLCTVPTGVAPRRAATCGPTGVDWTMPARLKESTATEDDVSTDVNGGAFGSAKSSYVFPASFTVRPFLTRGKDRYDAAADCASPLVQWRWQVTSANRTHVVAKPKPGCATSFEVDRLGRYALLARRYARKTVRSAWVYDRLQRKATVEAKDWLIAGIGDSNGSGESNPPWLFKRCNRSAASYQYRTALYLERQDPRSSVTFVFTSCSGARIRHLVSAHYPGTRAQKPGLPPQIDQVLALTHSPKGHDIHRAIDFTLLSIGVNDLWFGAVSEWCILHPATPRPDSRQCEDLHVKAHAKPDEEKYWFTAGDSLHDPTLDAWLRRTQSHLVAQYRPLAKRLAAPESRGGLGLKLSHVLLAKYPDFSTDRNGDPCNTTGLTLIPFRWNTQTWTWWGLQARTLDGRVDQTARVYGWRATPLSADAFSGHGYCAGVWPTYSLSWIRGVVNAVWNDNINGTLHPNHAGHLVEADATEPVLCKVLYTNTTCSGKWR